MVPCLMVSHYFHQNGESLSFQGAAVRSSRDYVKLGRLFIDLSGQEIYMLY